MAATTDNPETAERVAAVRPVALVTGASSGIGREIALQLAAAGHDVVLSARREQLLEQVRAQVEAAGGAALVVAGDVTTADGVAQLVQRAQRWRERLDVAVACAGVYLRKPIATTDRADLEAMLRANFWSGFELARQVTPRLLEAGRGSLVFVTSFDAIKGMPHDAAYVAAKSALTGYAGVLRQALRPRGVQVTTVLPGRVDTPMVADLEVPAISAKVSAGRVATAVVRAIRRRRAVVIVPWHCRLLQLVELVSPRLADWLVCRLGLDGRAQP